MPKLFTPREAARVLGVSYASLKQWIYHGKLVELAHPFPTAIQIAPCRSRANHLNIEFVSFRENLDTGGPLGQVVVIIIGAIAKTGLLLSHKVWVLRSFLHHQNFFDVILVSLVGCLDTFECCAFYKSFRLDLKHIAFTGNHLIQHGIDEESDEEAGDETGHDDYGEWPLRIRSDAG